MFLNALLQDSDPDPLNLTIASNVPDPEEDWERHRQITSSMFQSMFPALNVQKVRLNSLIKFLESKLIRN